LPNRLGHLCLEDGLSDARAPITDGNGHVIAAMNIATNSDGVKKQGLLSTILPELRQAVARLNGILAISAG